MVSPSEGCDSNPPHHLHHHLGEIFQIQKYFFLQGLSPHHYYGTGRRWIEPPKGPINIWGRLEPLSWVISSRSLIVSVICSKCVIPSCSHLSWHGRVCFNIWKGCLWMTIMNSGVPMRFRLKSGSYIGLPIMFLSLRKLWPQVVHRQFPALIWQVGA